MKLDHVVIWAVDIELMRTFYETYCGAWSDVKYENGHKRFTSYFLTFPEGGRVELMHRPDIQRTPNSQSSREFIGYAHLGVELGSRRRPYKTPAGRRVSASRRAKTDGLIAE
jgi:lactoylglutathione lyase